MASASPGTVRVVYTGVRPGEKLHEELAFDAEAMRPTRHPDIHIWELQPPSEAAVVQMISQLSPGSRSRDSVALAAQIRRLIPESAVQAAA